MTLEEESEKTLVFFSHLATNRRTKLSPSVGIVENLLSNVTKLSINVLQCSFALSKEKKSNIENRSSYTSGGQVQRYVYSIYPVFAENSKFE